MKVKVGGLQVEGQRVSFKALEEPWTRCQLPDGTILRLKLVVTDIVRVHGDLPSGEPHYVVKSGNIVAVEEPDFPEEAH